MSSEDDSEDDLLLPSLITPEECLLQSEDETYDLRQSLLHGSMLDENDTDTDDEPDAAFLSGPSVRRNFPWPPEPSRPPSASTPPSHARPSDDSGERSGSVARNVDFF